LQRGVHVGDLRLHHAERADRRVELLALAHVGQVRSSAGLHDAERSAGQHHALGIQAAHQHAHAFADLTDDVLGGNLAILEHQFAGVGAAHAELVELLRGGETLHAFLDDEGGHAAAAGRIGAVRI
jgi:hypothetical protein